MVVFGACAGYAHGLKSENNHSEPGNNAKGVRLPYINNQTLTNKKNNIRICKFLRLKCWQQETETDRIIGNNGIVYSKKHYRFWFETNQTCYIYIFNKGTSGRFFPLLPNTMIRTMNRIKPDETNCIPNKEKKGFVLDSNTGKEKILIIASVKKLASLEKTAEKLENHQISTREFSKIIKAEKSNISVKDYMTEPDKPAIAESASTGENAAILMELVYVHK